MAIIDTAQQLFDKIWSGSPLELSVAAAVGYLTLVRLLRYRRRQWLYDHHGYKTRDDFAKMTNDDAYAIQKEMFEMEFPFTVEKGLQFALFRTYGIPTISKLLVKTKQLSTKTQAPRRLADTTVLIGEFINSPPESERATAAISRMNYLHSLYQKSGQISNDDLLYTLSLFALEPIRWVERYEWREMSDLERCAFGVFWKSVGDAMGISYENMRGFRTGWKDGLDWLDDVERWSELYEERTMVPDDYNHQTALHTTSYLLYDVPESLHPLGRQAVTSLMDDRLRKAMILPPPSSMIKKPLLGILWLRKVLLRYLSLPRPNLARVKGFSEKPTKDGRHHRLIYDGEPWYVEDSFWNVWISPLAWMRRFRGMPVPGPEYQPEGYELSHVGPRVLEGKGLKEWTETKNRLMQSGRGGCPFAMRQ